MSRHLHVFSNSLLQVRRESDIHRVRQGTFDHIYVEHKHGPQKERGSDTLYAWGCRYYFTPLAGVLFTFPSRYLFTIGCQGVFSLIRWSGQIHAEFHVHRITWDSSRGTVNFAHPAVTVYGRFFQIVQLAFHPPTSRSRQPRKHKCSRFRLFRFRSPLLTESLSFSFPGVTEMFHFAPFRFVGL